MYFLVIAFFLLIGCNNANEPTKITRRTFLPVVELLSINKQPPAVTFNTVVEMPAPCWYYVRANITQQQNVFLIQLQYETDPQSACSTFITYDTVAVIIDPVPNGSVKFSFWKSSISSLGTTIDIP